MEILLLRMFAILFRRYSMETLKCAEECTFVIISNFVHDFVNSQFSCTKKRCGCLHSDECILGAFDLFLLFGLSTYFESMAIYKKICNRRRSDLIVDT